MEILAIGDPHGVKRWKYPDIEHADHVVFMGDYWDSFDASFKQQKEVFLEIIDLKTKFPKKITLLLGNHDIHYMPKYSKFVENGIITTSETSGFQHKHKFEITYLMEQYKDLFQHVYQYKNWVFSHAGICQSLIDAYINSGSLTPIELEHLDDNLFQFVFNNIVLPEMLYVGYENGGDDLFSGLFWIRPWKLKLDLPSNIKQVVGHTYNPRPVVSDHFTIVDCDSPVMFSL